MNAARADVPPPIDNSGLVWHNLPSIPHAGAELVAPLPGGKWLVYYLSTRSYQDTYIVRVNADFTEDTALPRIHLSNELRYYWDIPTLFGSLPDGRVVLGSRRLFVNTGTSQTFLAVFGADGKPDASFGEGGTLLFSSPFGGSELLFGGAFTADGKILLGVLGEHGSMRVLRLTGEGDVDFTFGRNGVATVSLRVKNLGLPALVTRGDGSIVLAVNRDDSAQVGLIAFDRNGKALQTFGDTGIVHTDLAAGSSLSLKALDRDRLAVYVAKGVVGQAALFDRAGKRDPALAPGTPQSQLRYTEQIDEFRAVMAEGHGSHLAACGTFAERNGHFTFNEVICHELGKEKARRIRVSEHFPGFPLFLASSTDRFLLFVGMGLWSNNQLEKSGVIEIPFQ